MTHPDCYDFRMKIKIHRRRRRLSAAAAIKEPKTLSPRFERSVAWASRLRVPVPPAPALRFHQSFLIWTLDILWSLVAWTLIIHGKLGPGFCSVLSTPAIVHAYS